MSAVLKFDYALNTLECATCCMTFAVPNMFITDRRNDHQTFYCPQGHSNVFSGKSEAEKLRDVLAQKERDLVWERSRTENLRSRVEKTERKLRATKGVVTKTKQRIARGKCPKCSCEFVDLAKHMANQHPDYAEPVSA